MEALYEHLPEGVQKHNLSIRSISISPAFPDILLIAAAITEEEQQSDKVPYSANGALLFSYDLRSGEVTLRLDLPYNLRPYDEFSFSPDGEWLTVKGFVPFQQSAIFGLKVTAIFTSPSRSRNNCTKLHVPFWFSRI